MLLKNVILAYYHQQDYSACIDNLTKFIALDATSAAAYNNRGNSYADLGQHEQAVEDYNQAIKLNPDYAAFYYNRGISYDALGQHKRAIEDYKQAIKLNPDYAAAYYKSNFSMIVDKGDFVIKPLPQPEARVRTDLTILLNNIETSWIQGVLEKSVHNAVLIELEMETRSKTIDRPWRIVMESPGQVRRMLSPEKSVKEIFAEANQHLLIVGEPGSGKVRRVTA